MHEKRLQLEITHQPIDRALYPFILPSLHRLLNAPDPFAENARGDYHALLDLGLADGGRLIVSPDVLLAAISFVPFDEEMNRIGQL